MQGDDDHVDNHELAERRTDWAEDRTLLANERTYAGWMRTGVASAALGLGFHAIFQRVEPTWLAKTVATIFICLAIGIFLGAFYNARGLLRRMDSHAARPLKATYIGWITFLFVTGSIALGTVLWLL